MDEMLSNDKNNGDFTVDQLWGHSIVWRCRLALVQGNEVQKDNRFLKLSIAASPFQLDMGEREKPTHIILSGSDSTNTAHKRRLVMSRLLLDNARASECYRSLDRRSRGHSLLISASRVTWPFSRNQVQGAQL